MQTRGQEIRGRAGVGEGRAHIRDKGDARNDDECEQVGAANEAETKHGRDDERSVDVLRIVSVFKWQTARLKASVSDAKRKEQLKNSRVDPAPIPTRIQRE